MNNSASLILNITNHLALIEQIETAVPSSFRLETVHTLDQLAPPRSVQKNKPGEPVRGFDSDIYAALVERQPALILFDFDQTEIIWHKWIPIIKASPATRRIPIVGHTAEFSRDLRQKAKSHGADHLIPRERFLADLSDLITTLARTADTAAIADACAQPLAPEAIKGLELFNTGEYFDAHEELEHAWKADQSAGRDLYRSVLQIAVAYLQIERGNYNGAIKMLQRVKQWIDPLPAQCRGIEVGRLRDDATAVYEHLQALGRERMGEFDRSLMKPVTYTIINHEK